MPKSAYIDTCSDCDRDVCNDSVGFDCDFASMPLACLVQTQHGAASASCTCGHRVHRCDNRRELQCRVDGRVNNYERQQFLACLVSRREVSHHMCPCLTLASSSDGALGFGCKQTTRHIMNSASTCRITGLVASIRSDRFMQNLASSQL